uniref:Ig-like domain-containing protein n=1 Tax=Anopheles stephensi TaxID=30069 RepID=A0A182YKE6_ANOST
MKLNPAIEDVLGKISRISRDKRRNTKLFVEDKPATCYPCYMLPPDIVNDESSADIAVQEGEDATIVCKATGHPTPRVTWKREDGEYMLLRKPQSRELIRGR